MRKIKYYDLWLELNGGWYLGIQYTPASAQGRYVALQDKADLPAIESKIHFEACTVPPEQFWNELYEALVRYKNGRFDIGSGLSFGFSSVYGFELRKGYVGSLGIVDPKWVDPVWRSKLAAAIEEQIFEKEEEDTVEYRGNKYRVCEGLRLEEV